MMTSGRMWLRKGVMGGGLGEKVIGGKSKQSRMVEGVERCPHCVSHDVVLTSHRNPASHTAG